MPDLALYLESRDIIRDALADSTTFQARKQGIQTVDRYRRQQLAKWPKKQLDQLRDSTRAAKADIISNLQRYTNQVIEALTAFDCNVYLAKTVDEAQNIIKMIVGENKLIIKSKTNVGKELELTKILETQKNRIIETDLGDRLVQMDQSSPSHPLAPAIHIPLDRMVELISADVGKTVEPTPKSIVAAARGKIRQYMIDADIGITGANFIAAAEGIIGVCSNEGNARLVSSLPEEHIIVTGVNKLIPSLDHAPKIIKLLSLYGLGMVATCYTSLISGPSRTGDIQFKLVLGMHGPKKVHVVLLDNERSNAIGTPLEEALYCLNCGTCADVCPAYAAVGPRFGDVYAGAIGPIWAAIQHSVEKAVQSGLYYCTMCEKCKEFCPVKIDLPKILRYIRGQAHQADLSPEPLDERSTRVKTTGDVFGGL